MRRGKVVTILVGAVALAAGWLHDRPGALRVALRGLLAVAALAVLVMVVLVGDAGARAVWTAS